MRVVSVRMPLRHTDMKKGGKSTHKDALSATMVAMFNQCRHQVTAFLKTNLFLYELNACLLGLDAVQLLHLFPIVDGANLLDIALAKGGRLMGRCGCG